MMWIDQVEAKRKRKNRILFDKGNVLIQPLQRRLAEAPRRVVTLWALEQVGEVVAKLEQLCPGDARPREMLEAAWAWARGEIKMPEAKRYILACHVGAKETADPVIGALYHAAAQGGSTVHTTGHAIGLAIYGLTALAVQMPAQYQEAVEKQMQIYVERLQYWSANSTEYTGPWAPFFQKHENLTDI